MVEKILSYNSGVFSLFSLTFSTIVFVTFGTLELTRISLNGKLDKGSWAICPCWYDIKPP